MITPFKGGKNNDDIWFFFVLETVLEWIDQSGQLLETLGCLDRYIDYYYVSGILSISMGCVLLII